MEKKMNEKQVYLGMDVGTTTSQIAVVSSSGTVQVLPNMDGDLITPSIVSVADKKPTVGKVAKQDRFLNPDKVAEQFKKAMATVTENGDPIPVITGSDGTEFTAIALSAELIRYLKESAEKIQGQAITKAVISVPAYFKRQARVATKEAGLIAGFETIHIVDEPTAGATFYGLADGKNQKIAVFDFGGGTFDISILQINSDGHIDPIAVDGNPECGGSNVDEVIFQHVREFIEKKGGKLDPQKDLAEWLEVLDSCKQAKEMLAHKDAAIVPLRVGSDRFSMEITYEQMKEWASEIIETLRSCCKRALEKAGLKPSDLAKIVLIGGSSRLRFVPEIIKNVFGQEPVADTDPDMAVAKGNAILAAAYFAESGSELLIEGKRYLSSSVKPSQIAGRDLCVAAITRKESGDNNEYNVPIIPSKAKLPYEALEYFTPNNANISRICVKLIDGPPNELSSNFAPLQEAEIAIQPTSEQDNEGRIEFKVTMDAEGMVDIEVRDKLLNKPVPIKFKFCTELSDSEINDQRKQLVARHKS
jgi:molecular chaperone DnaK